MADSQYVDDSIRETLPESIGVEPEDDHFAPRVVLGTMIGLFSCLLLAALLMLIFWLPFVAGGGLAGADGRAGQGSGQRDGDGKSAQADDGGDDQLTVFDQESAIPGTPSGNPAAEVPGNSNDPASASVSATAKEPLVKSNASDTERPRQQRFTIPPIESIPPAEPGEQAASQAQAPGMFEGRGAEERAKLAESEGGSVASEKAVEAGLVWMAKHQDKSGAWQLHAFSGSAECRGECDDPGVASDAAGTGFGLLPFLGAGHTHKSGKYKDTVKRGLDWLIADQNSEGTFQNCMGGTMYAHGIATIALCEAYAMTRDPELKEPAQRAIDYILKAQHNGGGWRYGPGQPGDTSVTGWQVIALRSAQQGGLKVPASVFTRVSEYLDSVQTDKEGSGYRYMPNGRITDAMIAEGLLCRIYSSAKLRRSELRAGVEYLQEHLPRVGDELYYWYYATQVMHHYGGEPWDEWNHVMRDLLIEAQATTGHEKGSWAPQGGHDHSGGRVYATSLALLTLEVYYRHKRAFE